MGGWEEAMAWQARARRAEEAIGPVNVSDDKQFLVEDFKPGATLTIRLTSCEIEWTKTSMTEPWEGVVRGTVVGTKIGEGITQDPSLKPVK